MIKLITGKKGTGKTKILIDEINEAVNASNGNIATVEKGSTIRYSISRKVRWCDTELRDTLRLHRRPPRKQLRYHSCLC